MSALENLALEKVRERIGAIVLLTQNSGGTHYMKFVNTNIVDGALDLMKEDYVKKEGEHYILTESGWEYARKTLESVGRML